MECYYHPNRESTNNCAICGKSICQECGLEIAGKVYCKECLEKIVGIGIDSKETPSQNQIQQDPVRLDKQNNVDYAQQPQEEIGDYEMPYAPKEQIPQEQYPQEEIRQIQDDSPYNIKSNIEYTKGPDATYSENINQQIPQMESQPQIAQNEYDFQNEGQITQNEYDFQQESQIAQKPIDNAQDYIYPDHSYQPEPTGAITDLEDKYEKYLDDLYFDEAEVPLGEQLAKDEEEYGSLTKRPYKPRPEEALLKEKAAKKPETPEEMEARIRAEILAEAKGDKKIKDNIHNLNYQEEKEPMGAVDIILTIILIIVILVVIYYLIYVFILNAAYPTFMDAVYALSNPQNVINNILTPPAQL